MNLATRYIIAFFCFAVLGHFNMANADDSPKKPHQIIEDLRQRMYAIGETTGRLNDFVEAEQKAVIQVRTYMAGGDPADRPSGGTTRGWQLRGGSGIGFKNSIQGPAHCADRGRRARSGWPDQSAQVLGLQRDRVRGRASRLR